MKKYEDIPLFKFGASQTKMAISQQAVEDCIHTFHKKPVFIYDEADNYNKNNKIVGIIDRTTKIEDGFLYGDIIIWNEYMDKDLELNKFRNYEINAEEYHNEEGTMIVDKFTLFSVSFDTKGD